MYWTLATQQDIWRSSLDGADRRPIATMVSDGNGWTDFDVDVDEQKLYWIRSRPESTGSTTFGRANLDGTGVETLFVHSICCVNSVAIAPQLGAIFWGKDQTGGESRRIIQRANITTGELQQTIAVGRRYSGVAVDDRGGKVYWATHDPMDRRIQRANLDGSDLEDIVTQDLMPIGSQLNVAGDIVIDHRSGVFYWINEDLRGDEIFRGKLDGSGIERVMRTDRTGIGEIALYPIP